MKNLKEMTSFKTLSHHFEAEMTERRSVFLGYASPVTTEEEAIEYIAKIKKRHSSATHNVYAYILRGNISRFSDDGEPHGTAGLPVLEVLRKENITDAVVVVTRYFGGILLGAGGLVRAYSAAAKLAVDGAEIKECTSHVCFSVNCTYSDNQKLLRIFEEYNVQNIKSEYSENVTVTGMCLEKNFEPLKKAITDITGGRVNAEITDTVFA